MSLITTHWMQSAAAAKAYYRSSDYYASVPGDWLGNGAKMLGLTGQARAEDFDHLADNLNPMTGEPLTTFTRDGRRVGMDMTFNSVKSVGIARELAGADNAGDPRIEQAHREAVTYTVGMIEAEMEGRVRMGGRQENRTTGNIVAYRVTHRDTRINANDQMPDPSLHDHVFMFNATWDATEKKWKAAELGQLKHDLPYFEAAYHNRLASNLKALGYGVERKGKGFEIAGVSDDLVKKFSRRTAYINGVADKLGIVNPQAKAKLGATTRLGKAKELADDLNGYYVSRLTDEERQELGSLQGKTSYLSSDVKAVEFAISHTFERRSVVDAKRLYETALRHGIGSVTPEGVEIEAKRQGVLLKGAEATTRDVLAEEGRIIGFARDGRGTCRPMGNGAGRKVHDFPSVATHPAYSDPATLSPERQTEVASHTGKTNSVVSRKAVIPSDNLSPEQSAIARHVWDSPDRVILIRGAAGTGKTHTMKATIAGIDRPVVVLAPSADASRGVLRSEGFKEADTVARFLMDEKFQQKAKDGVIWVDEAGLLGIRQVREVFEAADRLGARVVLQGDKRQHASVERGATLRVLEEFAGLPVAELRDIRRQRGRYREAVTALSKGDMVGGFDTLEELGWVKQSPAVDHNKPLVDDYFAAFNAGKSVLVVAPTHVEGDEITAEIRAKLKEREVIGKEGHQVETLVPLHWTEADRGDLERYEGTEVMQFHRNSGTFRAGDRVKVTDWKPGDRFAKASHFSVYAPSSIELAAGDSIRFTANGKTKDEKHKLNNGAVYRVKGFTKDDDVVLDNGWVVGKDFKFLTHGYVTTSHASQGKTVDRVLIAMGNESRPAISAEQFYVSVSRGKENATIYSDMAPATLREAIERSDVRKSATELMGQTKVKPKAKAWDFMQKARSIAKSLRSRAADVIEGVKKRREHERAR